MAGVLQAVLADHVEVVRIVVNNFPALGERGRLLGDISTSNQKESACSGLNILVVVLEIGVEFDISFVNGLGMNVEFNADLAVTLQNIDTLDLT